MKTPHEAKKKIVVEIYTTEIIFSRVLYLNSTHKIKINDFFSYEIVPLPTVLVKTIVKKDIPYQKLI